MGRRFPGSGWGGGGTSPSMAQMIFRQSLVLVSSFRIQISVFGFWNYPWSGAPHARFSLPPLSPSAPSILALVTRSAQTARALSIRSGLRVYFWSYAPHPRSSLSPLAHLSFDPTTLCVDCTVPAYTRSGGPACSVSRELRFFWFTDL